MTVVRDELSLRNLLVRAFDSRVQGFSPPLARQRSSCPPPSPNLVRTPAPPGRELRGSPRQCFLPLACRHPPEGHQIGARKKRTPGNTILSQPYRRRVSTDRLNREGSQFSRVSPALHPPERPSHTFFPSGWCFFYLVTTGWIFDTSLCDNSINQSKLVFSQEAGGLYHKEDYFITP